MFTVTEASDPYASHLPVLRALSKLPIKRVLELGAGRYSSRVFMSMGLDFYMCHEPDKVWAGWLYHMGGDRIQIVNDYSKHLDGYDLIFVDNGTNDKDGTDGDGYFSEERVSAIEKISEERVSAIVLIHDYERIAYQRAADFEHTWVYTRRLPQTAVCWNGDRPDVEAIVRELE